MPLPNPNILNSLFEFYLTYRTANWKLDSKNPAQSKLDTESEKKRATCIEALTNIQQAMDVTDWIKTSYALYDLECKCIKADPSWITWASNKIGKDRTPLLAKVICAARAYVNAQLKGEEDYLETVKHLSSKAKKSAKKMLDLTENVQGDISATKKSVEIDKSKLSELKLKALTENQDYQKSFFISDIKVKDPHSERLNEQSFNDFMANVLNGSRKNIICAALLESIKPVSSPLLEKKPVETKPVTTTAPKIPPMHNARSPGPQPSPGFFPAQIQPKPKDATLVRLDDKNQGNPYSKM